MSTLFSIAANQRREIVSARRKTGRAALIAIALGFLGLFIVLPLLLVFLQAFARGWDA